MLLTKRNIFLCLVATLVFAGCTIDNPDIEPDKEQHRKDFENVYPRYIAHAGGMIDGISYTNSLEAVQNAIGEGIKFIELDLALTADGEVVCLHDWYDYNRVAIGRAVDSALSLSDFLETRLYGKYTPLCAEAVVELWQSYPDLWLVTDKISDPEIIVNAFNSIQDRVMVECFTYADYLQLQQLGYITFMSSLPPSNDSVPLPSGATADDSYVFQAGHDLSRYAFSECALFSCADRHAADSLFATDSRITLIYTDDVTQ